MGIAELDPTFCPTERDSVESQKLLQNYSTLEKIAPEIRQFFPELRSNLQESIPEN